MGLGSTLRQLMEAQGIKPADLAPYLRVGEEAVRQQLKRENAQPRTYLDYADAINAVLAERGDSRRVSAESLRLGPELANSGHTPNPPTAVSTDTDWLIVDLWDGVACGVGMAGYEAEPVGTMAVPVSMAGAGATRANCRGIIARGESMCGAGVEPGDQIVVRTDIPVHAVRPGKLVVIQRNSAGPELRAVSRDAGSLVSVSRDGSEVPVDVAPLDEVTLIGVVKGWYHEAG